MAKYDALGMFLADHADDQHQVELTFGRIDALVGGLPPSARRLRTWWANNSQGQSLTWQRSGWHVLSVDLAGSTVVFARGQVGGSYAARGRVPTKAEPSHGRPAEPADASITAPVEQPAAVGTVDARVTFDWRRLGEVELDSTGKLAFPGPLPASPGLYRFTLVNRAGRSRIYIGESDNLRRRLGTNYRNPGPRQQTSRRVNAFLVEHLRSGAEVVLDIADEATIRAEGIVATRLNLGRKAGRLFAESAALVIAQLDDAADIENLG